MKSVPRLAVLSVMALHLASRAAAEEQAVRYEFGDRADIRIVTEAIVSEPGTRMWRHPLSRGSRAEEVRAVDRATGRPLASRIDGNHLVVELGTPLPARAERRIGLEEIGAREHYITAQGAVLVFAQEVRGRATVVLPPGYTVRTCNVPAQFTIEDSRQKVGVIAGATALPVRLEVEPGASAPSAPIDGSFRADDERSIVYWLEDPSAHRISLALEMLITKPGQSHIYSVLRKEDHITNPVTLDVDRGSELPTRIVSGREAATVGDSPTPIPPDASVFVADLGYQVPPGGSTRVRLYQVATDAEGYQILPNGELRWNRFLGRLRTRAVLPKGWSLTSVDQPAMIGRDEQGRVVLDFIQTGADSPKLVVTARKVGGGS